jgi:hypothetical protein
MGTGLHLCNVAADGVREMRPARQAALVHRRMRRTRDHFDLEPRPAFHHRLDARQGRVDAAHHREGRHAHVRDLRVAHQQGAARAHQRGMGPYVVRSRDLARARADRFLGRRRLVGRRGRDDQRAVDPGFDLACRGLGRLVGLRAARAPIGRAAEHRAREALRVGGEQLGDHDAAERIADHMGFLDVQMVHQPQDIQTELVVGARLVRLAAVPVPAQVEGDHAVVARQVGKDAVVDPGTLDIAGEAVHQNDRRALALIHVPEAHPARIEVAVLGARRAGDQEYRE